MDSGDLHTTSKSFAMLNFLVALLLLALLSSISAQQENRGRVLTPGESPFYSILKSARLAYWNLPI